MTLPVAATRPKSRKSPLHMKPPPAKISEAKRQAQIVGILRSLGYEVQLIGQKRQPIICKNIVGGRVCGKKHWPITTANTPGAADLLVSHKRWPSGWIGLECNTPDTTRRPEQVRLAELGMNTIVETVQEALEAILHLEQQWEIAPLAAMTAYREQQ